MGISLFASSRSSKCECRSCRPVIYEEPPQTKPINPNPDPFNWIILESCQFGDYLAVKIQYPNCTNYEGQKILVFKSTISEIRKQKKIDPHFGEDNLIYPIARFQPTHEGWTDALQYAESKHGFATRNS